MSKLRLSALVVAHDEERQLGECLACLEFADETVVVLDRCRDRSQQIARRFTGRIVEGAWDREGPRRHAGIDACRGEWILEVDADERVPPELAAEIRRVVETSAAASMSPAIGTSAVISPTNAVADSGAAAPGSSTVKVSMPARRSR